MSFLWESWIVFSPIDKRFSSYFPHIALFWSLAHVSFKPTSSVRRWIFKYQFFFLLISHNYLSILIFPPILQFSYNFLYCVFIFIGFFSCSSSSFYSFLICPSFDFCVLFIFPWCSFSIFYYSSSILYCFLSYIVFIRFEIMHISINNLSEQRY